MLNPDNVTVDPNINDAEIAFAGATFTPDFTFPTPNSESSTSSTPAAGLSSSSSGLSTGAKAGIGAAAAAVLAILIGVCVYIRQRRRSAKKLGVDRKYQYPVSYPMKNLEVSISHEELVANAAKPARGPIKEMTPSECVLAAIGRAVNTGLGWGSRELAGGR